MTMTFDGDTYVSDRDHDRLSRQLDAVRALMLDGTWRSLGEIEAITHAPQASVSARLRDLRKSKHGSWLVERRYIARGLYQYRVRRPVEPNQPTLFGEAA